MQNTCWAKENQKVFGFFGSVTVSLYCRETRTKKKSFTFLLGVNVIEDQSVIFIHGARKLALRAVHIHYASIIEYSFAF